MGTINDVFHKVDKDKEDWTHIEEDVRSLKSCLRKFGFVHLLQDLDDNLEAVRRHKISEDDHREMIKRFDKKLLKLSTTNHPDHADNKIEAHNNQATINAIRTLIIRLSEDFLRDIDIDYRYEYYAYTDINSIGNEEDVEKLNLNLQYQLIMLSEIKHEKIIANIKKFLMACEGSLDNYYDGDCRNFVLNFNLALNRLKECISGYRALTREFNNVEKECEKDHNLQNTLWTVKRMSADFERQLKILEKIKDVAKQSLKRNFQFYAEYEIMDSYFVLPFAKYINVLSMCNVMLGNTERSWYNQKYYKKNLDFFQLDGEDQDGKFFKAYFLASYFDNPNSLNESTVHSMLRFKFHGDNLLNSCKFNFDTILQNIREELKKDFNVEKHYIVRSVKKRTEEYNKEVQDFFEVMLRRKNSSMLPLIDGQGKSRNDGRGNAILLSQRIKYEKNISNLYSRASNVDIIEGIEGEVELLMKIRDNFKQKGDTLKTKILESEIANEKLRKALDINKMEERVLLDKLGNFTSKSNANLLHEIFEREEETRELSDKIQMRWDEERLLILTLSGKYEKISSMFLEKVNEIEKELLEKESRSSKNFEVETCYQEEGLSRTTIDRLVIEPSNRLAIREPGKENADFKNVESNVRNTKVEQDSIKKNKGSKTSGDEIDEQLSLYVNRQGEHVKYQPKFEGFDDQCKISSNAAGSKEGADEFERTCNFEENSRLKELSRHKVTKTEKASTNVVKENEEIKFYANYIKNASILQKYVEEKALEIDLEKKRSYEAFEKEQEKDLKVLEALRNLKESCQLKYQNELEEKQRMKNEHYQ